MYSFVLYFINSVLHSTIYTIIFFMSINSPLSLPLKTLFAVSICQHHPFYLLIQSSLFPLFASLQQMTSVLTKHPACSQFTDVSIWLGNSGGNSKIILYPLVPLNSLTWSLFITKQLDFTKFIVDQWMDDSFVKDHPLVMIQWSLMSDSSVWKHFKSISS